jgi:hypothetical protein
MSGDGKRGAGHWPQATAPIFDSTTFSVRCVAVIPSGYRVTFVVLVTRLAGELLTHNCRGPETAFAAQHCHRPSIRSALQPDILLASPRLGLATDW